MRVCDGPVKRPIPDTLLAMPTYALSLLGRAARAEMAAALPPGLRLGHLAVLGALVERSPQAQNELAETLSIHPTDLVAILDDLLERKLVTRKPDPGDRRRKLATPTAAGRKLVREATAASERIHDELLAGLSEKQRGQVKSLLRRALIGAAQAGERQRP
jgi:DNA-binding MarR family transcriptional regulator